MSANDSQPPNDHEPSKTVTSPLDAPLHKPPSMIWIIAPLIALMVYAALSR